MERALLSSSTIAITPRCESGYPSSSPSLIDYRLRSTPLLLRMEEKGRPEHTPMIPATLRRLHEGYAPQSSANPQGWQIGEGSPLIEHPMSHETALGEQFTALGAEKGHEKDSGHGGTNFGSVASNNNNEDKERMNPGPSISTFYVLWSCVLCLVLAWLGFSYIRFPLRLFHSLVPQALV